jgi:hypothetical protein
MPVLVLFFAALGAGHAHRAARHRRQRRGGDHRESGW